MTTTPSRVLGIVGSPRRRGNTEILVDQILGGAAAAGATAEKIILSDLKIAPCLGCDRCADTRVCVQQDDMHDVLQKMRASDAWVLGTPIYWWGATAQFKAYLDRWYSVGKADFFRGRPIVLAIPFGDSDPEIAGPILGMFRYAVEYVNARLFGIVLAAGVNERGDVDQLADVMALAWRTGQDLAGEETGLRAP